MIKLQPRLDLDYDSTWLSNRLHSVSWKLHLLLVPASVVSNTHGPDDSGGAIFSDGGYTLSAINVARTNISYNQASTGPAIAQTGKTEDVAARDVTFAGITFTGNTLLCQDGEFLDQVTNVSAANSSCSG